jgi:hypothetical protein
VTGGRVYALRGSALVQGDAATGEELAKMRVEGTFSASIVAAGEAVYCFNEQGQALVVRAADFEDEVMTECDLGEPIVSTPSVADGALYIRGERTLWKIAGPNRTATGGGGE